MARENKRMQALVERASFEFDCPAEQLDLRALTRFKLWQNGQIRPLTDAGVQVGVAGCDQRGVYIARNMGEWVLNSTSDREKADTPGEPSTGD